VREWRDCQVVGRNPTDGTWRIVEDQHSSSPQAPVGSTRAWEDPSGHFASDAAAAAEPTERSVHRVDLLFLAEDVFVFASRVAAAHAARRAAMDSLRFELYIDCVPPENGPPAPEAEATSRLLARALNSDALRSRRAAAQAMLAEVAADRDRTLTVVRFRAMAEAAHAAEAFDATVVSIFNKVPLPPPTWARPSAPALGMVADAPAHRCLARGNFHLTSLLTTGEAVTAAQRVKAECEAALRLPLLQTHWSKPATIDEYTEAQSRVTDGAAAHLREGWAGAIRNAIRHSLRDVGKGWFNLNEKDIEVYQVSKLKRLLAMLNLVVQDTIVALGEASLRAYADLVVARAAFRVVLHSSSDVALERLPEAQEAADKAAAANAAPPAPLFQLDLGVIDGVGFEYVHPPEEFAEEAVNAYMRAVGATQGLPQLERSVMPPSLISGSAPMATLDLTDGAVPRHLVRVREALHRALPHPQTYLALLSPYVPTAQLDVPAHVAKLGVASRSVSEIAADAREQLRRAAAVEAELPPRVNLGLFSVNAAPARDFLAQRHKEVARQLLGVVKARVSAAGADVTASFAAIENSLRRKLPDIEAVAELEEYIAALPSELMPLQESLRAMTREHAALDEFWTNLSDAEHSTYWKTLAWPRRIALRIGDAQAMCEAQRKVFASEMAVEQQTFDRSIERLERSVANYARRTDFEKADEVAAEVDRLTIDLQEAEEKRALFNRREVIFGTKATDYSALTKATKEFEPYAALWTTVRAWTASRREWMTGSFQAVNAEQMEAQLGSTSRTMHKLAKVFEGSAGLSEIARQISTEVDAFAPHMPVVMAMRNLGMRDRHWELMSKETGVDMKCVQAKSFTFEALLELDLGSQIEEIAKVADSAGKEYAIEQALDKMQAEWAEVLVETVEYRESGTHVLRGSDAVQQLLDDHIVMTQSMAFSPYKGPFARRIDLWEKTLASISDIYEEWLLVQRAWMYLEPVFSSDDIMRQLPAEGKRFISVDRAWRRLMATASQRSSVVDYCRNTPRLLQILRNANAALELVQKGLAEYLETKRIAFARFYFLSNDELLEILSETRDPKRIQPHLKKCFENIDKLVFEPDEQMTAMVSGEGEVVPFTKGLYATGGVEIWMGNVLEEMQTTVRRSILEAWEDYGQTPRGKWVLRWPGATLIAGSNIAWTLEVEAALNENGNAGLRKYFDVVHSQLLELTRIVSGEVTKLQRKSLGALITIDVHQRDVVGSMADAGVSTTAAFEWISQLRYELASEKAGKKDPFNPSKSTIMPGDCLVKQLDGWFKYGNEYLGNSMRLVITPLTDRIYLTLTGALQLFLGGAPAGPAGTGKTETTKDLAKALAKQCLVFNCGPELDYLAMGKFFRGLAMSGAWACFDEFNRIDLEVLSVVAQQVSSIQQAMAAGLRRFEFEGNDISLDATCAIFITMNPGYTGRSELPDNLKALFRPVACMVPDYAMIAEIRLYSFGYTDARRLSQKMVKTFQLASEQVSSQDHYDFGMRAVNTVIQAAGNNRAADPSGVEDLLVLSALADSNRPKFLAEDMQLFESILSDLFPGVQVPTPDYTDLLDALRRQCDAAALIPTEAFVAKCVQIYEVSVLRHGFMTVGPSGGGKSAAKEVLLAAQAELDVGPDSKYRRHRQWFLNPKAVTMGQLYGQFDENTHEWSDGILCILYRAAVKEFAEYGKTEKQWLVFDGPVDALWIESMNTVLDDNRKLCLVSGEIITMTPHMIMVCLRWGHNEREGAHIGQGSARIHGLGGRLRLAQLARDSTQFTRFHAQRAQFSHGHRNRTSPWGLGYA
jgi:dynein heavy chain